MQDSATINEIRHLLSDDGLIHPQTAVLRSLSGGVSCDVVAVTDGDRSFVVKRALAKLKVESDWYADVGRNRYEHRFLSVAGRLVPNAVPKVLYHNDEKQYFCMELLEDGWKNWKSELLNGVCHIDTARHAGRILGLIHKGTAGNQKLAAEFATDQNFFELRLDPYLLATGKKHEALRPLFEAEADRISHTHRCLVHGDYSPKNLLASGQGIKVLDCEVAWYGDPSFDLAFLLNHFLLKFIHHAPQRLPVKGLFDAAIDAYVEASGFDGLATGSSGPDSCRNLLLMLLLARVDGKSPVEYLMKRPDKQDFIRSFVRSKLVAGFNGDTLKKTGQDWFNGVKSAFP